MAKIKRFAKYDTTTLSDSVLCVAAELEQAFIKAGISDTTYSGREILAMAVDLIKPSYQANALSVCTSWEDMEPSVQPPAPAKWTAATATHKPFERVKQASSKMLRLDQVTAMTGMKKSSIYSQHKAGRFPAPVKLAARAVGWREEEVQQWIAER